MPPPYVNSHWNVFAGIPYNPQGPVGYIPDAWAQTHAITPASGFPGPQQLPTKQQTRADVRAICRDPAYDVLYGYVCAMAWGLQGAERGGPRHVAAAWAAHAAITDKLQALRVGGITRRDAYNLFRGAGRVPGLGPSYFTKLLYFFSPATDYYIMDQWTGKSVNLLTGMAVVRVYESSPTNANKGGNYQAFCEELDAMAGLLGCTGPICEERLFSRGRPSGPWRSYVKLHYPYDAQVIRARYPHISPAAL